MPKIVSIVTGPVVGVRSTWFLEETVKFAASLGKRIQVFNVFDEILELADIQVSNAYERAVLVGELLDGYQYQFDLLRMNAYQSIARKLDRMPRDAYAVVRAPATIEWRGVNIQFKDHKIIANTLKPDRIVTLIDAEWKMLKRIRSDYGQHVLRVIAQNKDLTVATVLRWLASEVSVSEDWAEWCSHLSGARVRHYVLGVEAPSKGDRSVFVRDVDNMTKAATESALPSFYVSYSMTVAGEEERREINDAIWRLRTYGLVIDPGSIEIESNVQPEDESVIFAYTVYRDLRWNVQKVDSVAAFHPYKAMPPLSTGMMDELGHARAFRKDRYLVLPKGGASPFTGGTYIPRNHLFTETQDFFNFIENRRRPILKPRFAAQVEGFARWGVAAQPTGSQPIARSRAKKE